jgi:putative effector of murein hydrolase LrgA (UPF0299 family)
MIQGFATLLVLQLVGEMMARAFALTVPGPVLGMVLLVVVLAVAERMRPTSDDQLSQSNLGRVAQALLANLALLFVPAGVGIVQYLGLFADHGVALAAALVLSTFVTLIATVAVFLLVKKLISRQHQLEKA